ncbi:MAG: superoxide dismutase, partial [Salinimicrobium sediminis]|nr:superoxide dismutase [Salinimicrobium sediminis]
MAFELPPLKYASDALEPHIDARTMEIHHDKHHAGYTSKLNDAIEGTDMEGKNIENILTNLDMENKAVRNNGGGYFNHNLYWEIMGPNGGGKPEGELATAIDKHFGSFEAFKDE